MNNLFKIVVTLGLVVGLVGTSIADEPRKKKIPPQPKPVDTTVQKNPYEEGTQKRLLSDKERKALLQYADTAKDRLEEALEEAKGKDFGQQNSIYKDAIKEVVITSKIVRESHVELLVRVSLNQALELTLGIPNPSGVGIETPGVLRNSANQDLVTLILEDSIKLAIKFYKNDRQAVKEGSVLNMPYMQYAYEHLYLGRRWAAGIMSWKYSYEVYMTLLKQWHNIAIRADQKHQKFFASEILDVDAVIDPKKSGLPHRLSNNLNQSRLEKTTRKLRRLVHRLEDRMKQRLGELKK